MTTTRSKKFVLFLLFQFLISASAFSQEFHVDTYSSAEGLVSNIVYDVDQDPAGRMWFATRLGLVVYDGLEWRDLTQGDVVQETGSARIVMDDLGRVWTASRLPPIEVVLRDDQGAPIETFRVPLEGTHITTTGLAVRTMPDSTFYLAVATTGREVACWDGGTWRVWNARSDMGRVCDLVYDDDRLLIAGMKGLRSWSLDDPESGPVPVDGLEDTMVAALAEASDGDHWIVGGDWIGRLRSGEVQRISDGPPLNLDDAAMGMVAEEGPAGGLYFGTKRLLHYFHPD